MIRPLVGESFKSCKQFLWGSIHASQANIATLAKVIKKTSSPTIDQLARMVIADEKKSIRETFDELKELQRWFKTSGLSENEPLTREGKYGKI